MRADRHEQRQRGLARVAIHELPARRHGPEVGDGTTQSRPVVIQEEHRRVSALAGLGLAQPFRVARRGGAGGDNGQPAPVALARRRTRAGSLRRKLPAYGGGDGRVGCSCARAGRGDGVAGSSSGRRATGGRRRPGLHAKDMSAGQGRSGRVSVRGHECSVL